MLLHITPWERTALQLLALGTTAGALADRSGTGEDEVNAQLATLFAKMGAANRAEAVAAAYRRGLLHPGIETYDSSVVAGEL